MKAINVVKGRIAETLVNELLRRGGFRVYRFGYEAVLQNLTQIEHNALTGNSDIVRQIRSIPDFLIVKDKEPIFIEVKFRSKWDDYLDGNTDKDLINQLDRISQFWKAKVIFVTTRPPYFRISYHPYYHLNDGKIIATSLVNDKDLGVTRGILKEFDELVNKYYKTTSTRS